MVLVEVAYSRFVVGDTEDYSLVEELADYTLVGQVVVVPRNLIVRQRCMAVAGIDL